MQKKYLLRVVSLVVCLSLLISSAGFISAQGSADDEEVLPAYIKSLSSFLKTVEEEKAKEQQMDKYVVKKGDTLYHIARQYVVDPGAIVVANNLDNPQIIYPGQELLIPPQGEVYHLVVDGDTLEDLGEYYNVEWSQIAAVNNLDGETLNKGELLQIPKGTVPASVWQESIPALSRGDSTRISFSWPLNGTITSYYGPRWGQMHRGIDIARPNGTPIKAAAAGTVTVARWQGSYGYAVFIDHGNGWQTRYAHASKISVEEGDTVTRGETVALLGETGNATGPHVHFEIRKNGDALDPLNYLP